MHFDNFGDDSINFLISFINRVKHTNNSHIELSSHCYYELHLVTVYYFLIYCSIQFVIILSGFCLNFQVSLSGFNINVMLIF